MCGRYSLAIDAEKFEEISGFSVPYAFDWSTRYNIAPSQDCLLLSGQSDQIDFNNFVWGIKPSWLKDAARVPPPINARAETLKSKPYFRDSFKQRRAVVPATSFFEWASKEKRGNRRVPYKIGIKGVELFYFAAIWDNDSFAVITTEANEALSDLHHRMPVMFSDRSSVSTWLDSGVDQARELLKPLASDQITLEEVGTAVNFVSNDTEEVLRAPPQLKLL